MNYDHLRTECGCDLTPGKSLQMSEPVRYTAAPDAFEKWWQPFAADPTAYGWAQFSGANVLVRHGTVQGSPNGLLLAAELHLSSTNTSHHLRFDGTGWIATIITPIDDPNGVLEQRTFIHSADKSAKMKLHYQVAWQPDPKSGALRPTTSRLINPSAAKP